MYVSENYHFNGLGMNLGNLSHVSNAQTRSISPENFTGEKGGNDTIITSLSLNTGGKSIL
jgi:hypothetical protein